MNYAKAALTKSARWHQRQSRQHWGDVTPDTERYQRYLLDRETLHQLAPEAKINWYAPWRDIHDKITAILDAHANMVEAMNDVTFLADQHHPGLAAAITIENEARAAYLALLEGK